MATYLHFAPALALAVAVGPRRIGWRLLLAGAVSAVLPDIDVLAVGQQLVHYASTYGHRSFTHSLGFALLVGLLGGVLAVGNARRRALVAAYLCACTLSHPLLDGLIDRGICNAWLWPVDGSRLCLPWRPIPMGGVGLFGPDRLARELVWIGLPLVGLALSGLVLRHWLARRTSRAPRPNAGHGSVRAFEDASPRVHRQRRRAAMQALQARLLCRAHTGTLQTSGVSLPAPAPSRSCP